MKYSYLPEAHNDYILAIIGEEVGFIGTVLFFLVFAMLIYSAFRIAEQATDRRGALMASGSAVILAVQFLINALGILNVFPMTGKPLPFISYGGSSIIVSLMLAGLILRVSYESARRDEYDRRRESFAVMDEKMCIRDRHQTAQELVDRMAHGHAAAPSQGRYGLYRAWLGFGLSLIHI